VADALGGAVAATRAVVDAGLTDLGFAPEGAEPPTLMTTDIEASKAWTEENTDQVVAYLRAIAKARDYVRDPANADDVASRVTKISGEDPEAIKVALQMYFYDDAESRGLFPSDFHHVDGAFDATVAAYQELGLLKDAITEDEYMNYEFADDATQDAS